MQSSHLVIFNFLSSSRFLIPMSFSVIYLFKGFLPPTILSFCRQQYQDILNLCGFSIAKKECVKLKRYFKGRCFQINSLLLSPEIYAVRFCVWLKQANVLALKHCYLLNKAILLVCLSTLTFNLTRLKITWEESLGPEIIQIRLAWALVAVIY